MPDDIVLCERLLGRPVETPNGTLFDDAYGSPDGEAHFRLAKSQDNGTEDVEKSELKLQRAGDGAAGLQGCLVLSAAS